MAEGKKSAALAFGVALIIATSAPAQMIDVNARIVVSNTAIVERRDLGADQSLPAPYLRFERLGQTMLEVGSYGALNLGAGGLRFSPSHFIPAAEWESVGPLVGYVVVRIGDSTTDQRAVLLPVFAVRDRRAISDGDGTTKAVP